MLFNQFNLNLFAKYNFNMNYVIIISVFLCIFVHICEIGARCEKDNTYNYANCNSLTDLEAIDANEQAEWLTLNLRNTGTEIMQPLKNNAFKNCAKIKNLMIHGLINKIEPFAFKGLSKLETLIMDENIIEDLPDKIFKDLVNLQHVGVKNSNLKSVKSELFGDLWQLNFIDFADNKISEIANCAFCNLNNTIIILSNNSMETFAPMKVLGKTSYIQAINLDENKLKVLQKFGTMPRLKGVDVSNNNIEIIAEHALENSPNIMLLNLAHNKISNLAPNILLPTVRVEDAGFSLHLNNNQLQLLEAEFMQRIRRLHRVIVDGNPWKCNSLNEIIAWTRRSNGFIACDFLEPCVISCSDEDHLVRNITFH